MKLQKITSNNFLRIAVLIIGVILLGHIIFHKSHDEKKPQDQVVNESKKTIWTCAMHPQIRMDHPGKCPICGMDLIPLNQSTVPVNPNAITMSEEGIKLADVQTSIVSVQKPVKTIQLYGKIQADERLIQTLPSHFPGRIEKLLVNFTGEEIKRGQAIAQIYSPELITAQKELLEAVKIKELQPRLLEAAREKLRQWKFTDAQISEIENSGSATTVFDVYSTVTGFVTNKYVNVGDYVSEGSPLYEIADLSKVWAMFDAYETDLPWISIGDMITFTVQSLPGNKFSGTVAYIDPVVNANTRVSHVRLEVPNNSFSLKPEMFADGVITSHIPISHASVVIPQSAVLWTGTRSVVYIKIPDSEEPGFEMREITLGPSLNDSYVVLDGLMQGEEIVTNGTFAVDASAELEGKPSMMNREGGSTSSMPPGMVMPKSPKTK